jgi:hypothetical protein
MGCVVLEGRGNGGLRRLQTGGLVLFARGKGLG